MRGKKNLMILIMWKFRKVGVLLQSMTTTKVPDSNHKIEENDDASKVKTSLRATMMTNKNIYKSICRENSNGDSGHTMMTMKVSCLGKVKFFKSL